MRAAFGEMWILEAGSVKDIRRKDYLRRLEFGLPHRRDTDLDRCLVHRCDWLFLGGEGADAGLKLNAEIEAYHLEYLSGGKVALPRVARRP